MSSSYKPKHKNMQDENQQLQPNSQSNQPQGSLANDSTVVQPLSSALANPTPSTLTTVNTSVMVEPQVASSPATPRYNPSSVYPSASQTPQTATGNSSDYAPIGLTGSQMQQQKVPLPIGIYIIVGFNLVSLAIGFFDTSQNSAVYTIAMFVNLLLAVGLLLRLEIARKIMLWLEGITLVLMIVSLILLAGLQQRIQTLRTNYEANISHVDQSKLTTTQKQQLEDIRVAIAAKEKQAGKGIAFTYLKLGVTVVAAIVVIAYLTRPKVKEAFHKLES